MKGTQLLCGEPCQALLLSCQLLAGGVPLGGGVKKKKSTKNRKAAEGANEQQLVVADAGRSMQLHHMLCSMPALGMYRTAQVQQNPTFWLQCLPMSCQLA